MAAVMECFGTMETVWAYLHLVADIIVGKFRFCFAFVKFSVSFVCRFFLFVLYCFVFSRALEKKERICAIYSA